MKKYIFLTLLIAITTFFNACSPSRYVSVEPTYVEPSRPAQPTNQHIWVDGNWVWDRSAKEYTRKDGYWAKPQQGRRYQQGYWQKTPKGSRWVRGQWR